MERARKSANSSFNVGKLPITTFSTERIEAALKKLITIAHEIPRPVVRFSSRQFVGNRLALLKPPRLPGLMATPLLDIGIGQPNPTGRGARQGWQDAP